MPTPFDNSFVNLPTSFYMCQNPVPVAAPALVKFNHDLAREIGLDESDFPLEVLAGNMVPDGATPLAAAYAGHQFGNFVPQLGDGRAVLLGEVVGPDGIRRDIQLKGAGRTYFSRGGDGRAAIGPVLREYLVSEAMHALGVPTTRALAAVTTGEPVQRETPLPGAVLARVARSHLRVGSFQFHYARQDKAALEALAEYARARHYPEAEGALGLLDAVIAAQAKLIAKWMGLGFIHGVMNTDNVSIAGETIDYGPCAFMDTYHPETVFSSIDRQGRYAYVNQPKIAQWNLAQLAQTLVPLVGEVEKLEASLSRFDDLYATEFTRIFSAKLGLARVEPDFIVKTLKMMADEGVDFTLFFRRISYGLPIDELFENPVTATKWLIDWQRQTTPEALEKMKAVNPVFIPRNHRVEAALAAATHGDFAPFEQLLAVLSRPFEPQPENAIFENPPNDDERVLATFCGT
ncbi:MAG: YdiU family protein [Rhodobacteraceae bacterium]|nr:YdiU family protein [Paracoccaceae bacterium]